MSRQQGIPRVQAEFLRTRLAGEGAGEAERTRSPRVKVEFVRASRLREEQTAPPQKCGSIADQERLKRAFSRTVHTNKAKAQAYYEARCVENQAATAHSLLGWR